MPAPEPFRQKLFYRISTSAGLRQVPWIGSSRYLVNATSLEIGNQYAYSNQYYGGVICYYDRSLKVDPTIITSKERNITKLQAGVYAGYEHAMGRLSFPLQLGMYVFNRDINPVLFEQIGFRYRIQTHWSALLLLKAHGGRAELLHVGVGYQLK
jgi:hypothetical protein